MTRSASTLRVLASTAAAFLGLVFAGAPTAQAQTYCQKGSPDSWLIGNTGMYVRNWTSANLTPASWACTTVLSTSPTLGFKIEWNVWNYGFVHRMGREKLNKPLAEMNPAAKATYSMVLENRGNRGGVFTGLYGWIWGRSHHDPDFPHVEFYIIENWYGGNRANSFGIDAVKVGVEQIDGAWYDLYYRPGTTEAKPTQWWSIRQQPRTSGTISYVRHINEWRVRVPWHGKMGEKLGWIGFFAENQWHGASTHGAVTYSPFTIELP